MIRGIYWLVDLFISIIIVQTLALVFSGSKKAGNYCSTCKVVVSYVDSLIKDSKTEVCYHSKPISADITSFSPSNSASPLRIWKVRLLYVRNPIFFSKLVFVVVSPQAEIVTLVEKLCSYLGTYKTEVWRDPTGKIFYLLK